MLGMSWHISFIGCSTLHDIQANNLKFLGYDIALVFRLYIHFTDVDWITIQKKNVLRCMVLSGCVVTLQVLLCLFVMNFDWSDSSASSNCILQDNFTAAITYYHKVRFIYFCDGIISDSYISVMAFICVH